MTDTADWDRNNEAYLAAALGWLRLRLMRCASGAGLAPRTPEPSSEPARGLDNLLVPLSAIEPATPGAESRWRRRRARAAEPAAGAMPEVIDITPDAVSDDEMAHAVAAMAAAAAADPAPALLLLAERFGLSDFERDLLLLCIGIELDPSLAALCAAAHGDPTAGYPSFALAMAAFDNPSWQPLLPDRPLRHFSLIEIHQPAATPLTASALRADERVVSYAKGMTYVDDRLAPLLIPLAPPDPAASPPRSLAAVVDRIVADLKQTPAEGPLPAVQLLGIDQGSKELVAGRVADALGRHLFRLPAQLLPAEPGQLERLARLWQRECALVPIALYLDAAGDGPAGGVGHFLTRTSGLVLVDTAAAVPLHGRPGLVVEVDRPTATEQADLWRSALGPDAADAPRQLADQFDLGAPTIERIAAAAAVADDRPLPERVWTLCLAETRKGLDALAQRIEPKATWDDIVLPEPDLALLRMIADQVGLRVEVYDAGGFSARTSRGLGINALFAGPSGTGKTMAAEVIANHLRLNLYRIDLSAVVSKYIGETEKNLERLFSEAEGGGVILLFDEADALFGKRTEIRDSHDRYANIEVSYLLQRMESYRGLSILATNARSSLDAAFVRRLRFVVTFAYPRPAERKRIWQLVFPPATRTEGLDYDRLAQFNFAGGNIFSVALNAAFLAARDGAPVSMRHVLESARVETRKLERPVNEREYHLTDRMVSA